MTKFSFNIPQEKEIAYYNQDKNLLKTLKAGGENRNINPLLYGLKRFRNYILFMLAYVSPTNRLRVKLNKWKGVQIGNNVYIGLFVAIDNCYPEYVILEDECSINIGSMIITHFNLKKHFESIILARVAPVIIKKGAIIAVRSVLLPGVTIGEFSIVSAMSVVSEDVEPYTMVRGNPAKKIAKYKL